MKKTLSIILSIIITITSVTIGTVSVSAQGDIAPLPQIDDIAFDLTNHDTQVYNIVTPDGQEGTVLMTYEPSMERVPFVSDGTWKIYWYVGVINVSYEIKIKSYKITSADKLKYSFIGYNCNNAKLSYTSKKSTAYFDCSTVFNFGSTRFYLTAEIDGTLLRTNFF